MTIDILSALVHLLSWAFSLLLGPDLLDRRLPTSVSRLLTLDLFDRRWSWFLRADSLHRRLARRGLDRLFSSTVFSSRLAQLRCHRLLDHVAGSVVRRR